MFKHTTYLSYMSVGYSHNLVGTISVCLLPKNAYIFLFVRLPMIPKHRIVGKQHFREKFIHVKVL